MARFAITISQPAVKDGALNEPIGTSVRESRAKRHARKLIKDGKRNVMLWRTDGVRPVPVSYREPPLNHRWANGCNSTPIENGLPERVLKDAPGTRHRAAQMDFLRRRNIKAVVAMEANRA